MKNLVFLLLFVLVTIPGLRAEKIKFKAITKKELNVDKCDFYPEAKAVILEKKGEIDFDLATTKGLVYRYSEGVRIKILDDQMKDAGNVKVRLYSPDNNVSGEREKITYLSGWTYNLENGTIEKTKLEKSNIYTNRLNKYWVEMSFVLPNVKKGSVIEYSYMKESSYFENLEPWAFQSDLPTCHNELTYTIPEYFNFQSRMMGNMYSVQREEKWVSDIVGELNFRSKRTNMKVKNLPPVEEEPFVSNACDLPLRVEFQLVTVDLPGQPIWHIAGTYAQLNKKIVETDFWRVATRGNFPKEISGAVVGMNDLEKANYLFEWIKGAIAWDGMYGISPSKGLREALRSKSGSVGDINLALNALFRENGLEAYPVILSTRGNGILHPIYPNFNDFNYVVSVVKIGKEHYLCDATANVPLGLLPPRCLNGSGWMISDNGGMMLPLKGMGADVSTAVTTMRIVDGKLEVDIALMDKEYSALRVLDNYVKKGADKFQEALQARYVDWEFSDFNFKPERNGIRQNFKLRKNCDGTDMIYIQPFLYGLASEPLFKRDSRVAIVDFPYGSQQNISTAIEIPEGYEVEQLPEDVAYLLSNKGALFTFKALEGNGGITLLVTFTMKKLTYTPQEYPELKDFFDRFAELSKMVVVLKKKV